MGEESTRETTGAEGTLRNIVRAIYGRALTHDTPIGWGRMGHEERAALLEPHEGEIDRDVAAIAPLLEQARNEGWSAAHAHLRKADAFDPEAVDEVMASPLDPDADALPEEVPRGPFAGGWL